MTALPSRRDEDWRYSDIAAVGARLAGGARSH